MISITQDKLNLDEDDAIEQALHERDQCRSQFESLHQVAVSRATTAIQMLVANDFTRLERKWRRDPVCHRAGFAANHLGAAHLANRWTALVASLENEGETPSLDLMLECLRADGSCINIQFMDDDSLAVMYRFLMLLESPEAAIKAWLKISKCLHPELFRRRIELFLAAGNDARACRQELLKLARSRSAEWQKTATSTKHEFDRYLASLQNSPFPACQVDRTLGAAFRDARTRLNRAEKLYQKLLNAKARKDLAKARKSSPKVQRASATIERRPDVTNLQSQTTPEPTMKAQQEKLRNLLEPPPAKELSGSSHLTASPKPAIKRPPRLFKRRPG